MKLLHVIFFILIGFYAYSNIYGQAAPQEVTPLQNGDKVLFLGNSFTEWSGPLPSTIQSLIKASGSNLDVSFTVKVKGMGILKEYATWNSLGMLAEIKKGGWKYVVIQGWRDAIDTKDSQTSEGGITNSDFIGYPQCQDSMLKYFNILDAEVRKIGGKTILYEPHVSSNSWPTEKARSAETYSKLKNAVSCFHAPIVDAWDSVRVKYPVTSYACPGSATPGSFIEKLFADCGHQNTNGMTLDAMTFYTIFTRRSAATLKPVLPNSMTKPELYEELASIAYNTGKSILTMNNSGFTDNEAPSSPSGLQATNIMPDSYILTWAASSDAIGVLGYKVYKDNVLIGTTSTPKFAIGGLESNTSYAMKVMAFDSEGNNSDFSSVLSVTTATATSVDASGILMDWDFTAQGGSATVATTGIMAGISSTAPSATASVGPVFIAGNFNVNGLCMRNQNKTTLADAITANQYINFYIAPQAGNEITIESINVSVFSQNQPRNFTLMSSVAGFTNGNEISTLTSASASEQFIVSNHQNITTLVEFRIYVWGPNNVWESFGISDLFVNGAVKSFPLPLFPTGLKATNLSETGFTLGWKAAKDAVSYKVYKDEAFIGSTSSLFMNIGEVTINFTYSMTVVAIDGSGKPSEISAPLEVKIPDNHSPSIPINLTITGLGTTSFILNWDAATDNVGVTLYEIFMDGNPFGNTAATFLPVPYLTENTLYTMSVRSKDAAGNVSDKSTTIEVTTLQEPDTQSPTIPSALVSSAITETSFTLSWAASTDNVGVVSYDVFKGDAFVGTTATTTFNVSDLLAGTTYVMTVKARDAAENMSEPSAPLSVKTLDVSNAITPVNNDEVTIFPNPANDFITITLKNADGLVNLFLMDLQGRTIASFNNVASGLPVNISNLRAGVYLLRVDNKDYTVIKRLVIK